MGPMRLAAAAAACLAVAAPRPGRAEPLVALRLGAAAAFGSAVRDVPVGDTVRLQLPVLQLDAMWRVGRVAAGAYGSWGRAQVGACDRSCSGSVARLGVQAAWTFARLRGAEPWAGAAFGWEWATERRERGGTEVETRWRGLELLAAQGGVEWRVGRWLAAGPFVLAALGRYDDVSVDTGLDSASRELGRTAFHVWVQAGVRARLVLAGPGGATETDESRAARPGGEP
jgi:hypothetical protein